MKAIYLPANKFSAQKEKLRQALGQKLEELKKKVATELRESGARVAEALGERTFPSDAAIGLAVRAMRFDLGLVYCTPSRAFKILNDHCGIGVACSFYGAWNRGDIGNATKIIRQSGSPISGIRIGGPLDPSLRENVRNNVGRVVLGGKGKSKNKNLQPLQLVSPAQLAAEMKVAIAELGKTASGWYACAELLGGDGNGTPWKGTKVHGRSFGRVSLDESEHGGVYLTLENRSPLARKHISPGQVAAILEREEQRVIQAMMTKS